MVTFFTIFKLFFVFHGGVERECMLMRWNGGDLAAAVEERMPEGRFSLLSGGDVWIQGSRSGEDANIVKDMERS